MDNIKRDYNQLDQSNWLGRKNNFILQGKNEAFSDQNLINVLKEANVKWELDATAIFQLLSSNYFWGDRTILKGLSRQSWSAQKLDLANLSKQEILKNRNISELSPIEIADIMFHILIQEAIEISTLHKNVGILLSGGMDSRIIAGIWKIIQHEYDSSINVTALTWGLPGSRDVEYAKVIADKLDFNWQHFSLSPEDLIRNITICAERGCEYSPTHLHAMPRIRDIRGLDCIIGGIYGDSLGRGAYSGKHISRLVPLSLTLKNYCGFVNDSLQHQVLYDSSSDIEKYDKISEIWGDKNKVEMQYQAHYLRRMLIPAMNIINEKIPVFQMFASPKFYNIIWNMSPSQRNDEPYRWLIKKLDNSLSETPWAKTGAIYMAAELKSDEKLNPSYHNYYNWIAEDLFEHIKTRILKSSLPDLGVFNVNAITQSLNTVRISKHFRDPKLMQNIIWLASVAEFIAHVRVTPQTSGRSNRNFSVSKILPSSLGLMKIWFRHQYNRIIKS